MAGEPEKMQAIICRTAGGPEVLKISDVIKPKPGARQLLIKVEATALNRADLIQRQGKYPPPEGASEILGLELAGTVVSTGEGCTRLKVGDKVFGLLPGGGYAAFAVMHEDMAMVKPANLSMEEAAAIPEVFLTAFQSLLWLGKLKAGETVLIHAGASGVGTAAIQIADFVGANVIVTASKAKHKLCYHLGAGEVIDYKAGSFKEKVLKITHNKGVNLIIDFIAAPYWQQNIDCLRTDGALILLASLGGAKIKEFDLRQLLAKRLRIIGSTLRSRTLDYQITLTRDFSKFAMEGFKEGKLKPVVDKVFHWGQVQESHKYMEANKNAGKIVLIP